jgi:hypothetical protein
VIVLACSRCITSRQLEGQHWARALVFLRAHLGPFSLCLAPSPASSNLHLLLAPALQLDKVTADAAEFKAGYDKASTDAAEFKAGYDKVTADAAELRNAADDVVTQMNKMAVDMSQVGVRAC